MHTYIVRTLDGKHLVGIFAAGAAGQLFRMVDERLDPFQCEYLTLTEGAGLFISGTFNVQPSRCTSCEFVDNCEKSKEDEACPEVRLVQAPSANGLIPTEVLAVALDKAEQGAWKQFSRDDFEDGFGLDRGMADDPRFAKVVLEQMGLDVARAPRR